MYLTEREKDKLLVAVAARLAKERKEKGIKLNYPEAIAYITFYVMETAREGKKDIDEIEKDVKGLLTEDDVMEGVTALIDRIDIEAVFPDGNHLVTLFNPINPSEGPPPQMSGEGGGGGQSSGGGQSTGGSSQGGGQSTGGSSTSGGGQSSSGSQ